MERTSTCKSPSSPHASRPCRACSNKSSNAYPTPSRSRELPFTNTPNATVQSSPGSTTWPSSALDDKAACKGERPKLILERAVKTEHRPVSRSIETTREASPGADHGVNAGGATGSDPATSGWKGEGKSWFVSEAALLNPSGDFDADADEQGWRIRAARARGYSDIEGAHKAVVRTLAAAPDHQDSESVATASTDAKPTFLKGKDSDSERKHGAGAPKQDAGRSQATGTSGLDVPGRRGLGGQRRGRGGDGRGDVLERVALGVGIGVGVGVFGQRVRAGREAGREQASLGF